MGTQFWWFYDVIAAAVLLICIFLGGKKGALKSLCAAVGLLVAALTAYAVGGAVGDSMSKGTFTDSNAKKLERSISSDSFVSRYSAYLENMGYSLRIDTTKLSNILNAQNQYDEAIAKYVNNVNAHKVETDENVLLEKVREGFAVVIGDIAAESLSKYAAETAAETIRRDSSGMQELIPLLMDSENQMPAAKYIARNYTSPAYRTMAALTAFVIIFVAVGLLILCIINAFFGRRESEMIGTGSHAVGGLLGIVSGVAVILCAAVAVRLWAVMGSNEMLFFNNEAIEKSYVFKYFYDFIMKL